MAGSLEGVSAANFPGAVDPAGDAGDRCVGGLGDDSSAKPYVAWGGETLSILCALVLRVRLHVEMTKLDWLVQRLPQSSDAAAKLGAREFDGTVELLQQASERTGANAGRDRRRAAATGGSAGFHAGCRGCGGLRRTNSVDEPEDAAADSGSVGTQPGAAGARTGADDPRSGCAGVREDRSPRARGVRAADDDHGCRAESSR